ncbi:adhesion G-protein coupled receptor V1 [Protopterus annectens]|uniref:adhesion G-protein coupled receptor V1 n=1 Tax=Protopterus annectens TaxID=7888 RepID=UPI001CF9DAE6|nr:adhesion G-protein coupled receptor V1 [Protopterus annectens]
MPSVSSLAQLLLAFFIYFTTGETEVRFSGQTEFVVNETSTSVIRVIIEKIGAPTNVTVLILLQGDDTGDFETTSAVSRIPATEANRTIYIAVKDDELPEADETFIFYLILQDAPQDVKLGSPNSVAVTILSNDNAFGIVFFNMPPLIAVNEPRGRSQSVPLNITRTKGTYGTVTVHFEVQGVNPEEDLGPIKDAVTLFPGRSFVVYNLSIYDDQIPENDEIFTVQLTNVEGGAEINSSKSTVQIQINKNDSPLRFTQAFYLVPETVGEIRMLVTRSKADDGSIIGSDDSVISVSYQILTSNSTASAQLNSDFLDLQANRTIVFLPKVYESILRFQIVDDPAPEIAESFQIVLLENTLQGDALILQPSAVLVTIEPNDKPYGVLAINSLLLASAVIINEDMTSQFEGITVVRNGGTYGRVSVNWIITRNSSDFSPVTADLSPAFGTLNFTQGQMTAVVRLNIVSDDQPEEAEPFLFRLLAHTVQGGAEVDEPTELIFFIQDSDDVYGVVTFYPTESQKIESNPTGRFVSLSFSRQRGTLGIVRLNYTALYIPAGSVDPARAKDGVLNVTRKNSIIFSAGQTQSAVKLHIRNDAFLQNGAHFLIQLDTVELINITPLVSSISPRLGNIPNISLQITPDLANGEIGFSSNETLAVYEPENVFENLVSIALQRDGTDGQAVVFWSLIPDVQNRRDVTEDDLSPFHGSVTFLSGQSHTTINITIKADDIPEVNETVTISLDRVETERFVVYFGTSAENQILKSGFTSRRIVITENDDPGGVFEFSITSRGPYFIKEGETLELRIIRSKGTLLKQFVRCSVENGENEFYGNNVILEFAPGEREIAITLLARKDEIPELNEHYAVLLSTHGQPASKLGTASQVNVTILKNDDPHGVIQFIRDGLLETINETKGNTVYKADYIIERSRGTFGEVNISWIIEPTFTEDVYPPWGTITFQDAEHSKNITVYSVADEIPEEMESFTIRLMNVSGEARLGSLLTATLQITKNDDAVFFAEPATLRVPEGEVANFTVLRNGSTDIVMTVIYQTIDGLATENDGDFIPVKSNNTLIFEIGENAKNISIVVNDDNNPETDEPFYIILFNSTGDTVVYGAKMATVIIEASDDPNGIFSLEPVNKAVEEGRSNKFMVLRQRGHFGNVSVTWQLFTNDSALQPGQEFFETSGILLILDGEGVKPIILRAIPDNIPEFNEVYNLTLMNISGGHPGPGGQLADTNLSVLVEIPFNDDPFGVFAIDPSSQDREVAEDVLSEDDMSYITNFTVLRQQGTFGTVKVGWEILTEAFRRGLPLMTDFILVGLFPASVELRPHNRRLHTGTDALFFSGKEDAYGIVGPADNPSGNSSLGNLTFSAWVMPNSSVDGFIIAKTVDGMLNFGVKIQANETYVSILLYYTTAELKRTQVAKVTIMMYLDESIWHHILITLEDQIIEVYLDGSQVNGSVRSLNGETILNGPGTVLIGAAPDGSQRFVGLMQDVRLYLSKLSQSQIHELHYSPAKSDVEPVSGYLLYQAGETKKSFIISSRNDIQEEGEELFFLRLVSSHGGARIPEDKSTAQLRVLKSDSANGIFSFTGTCTPETADEGSVVSCIIERTRGDLDVVYVYYTVSQVNSSGINYNVTDIANASGMIVFTPLQRLAVLNLRIIDDEIPELPEHFRIRLVSVVSGDGKAGSTPTSGASIDPEKSVTDITVNASDHPYGLLQFALGLPPGSDVDMIKPASSVPSISVVEEIGQIRLLVVRAQGILGSVMVAYRTVPLSAISPDDYQDIADTLYFNSGERYKFIYVNITDDSVPELAKSFKVELRNPEGGVAELFRSEGSGSGDGDIEFFLPAVHQRANLGIASQIIVTIEASDDAHGVFQFSNDSLKANGTEPEGGRGTVMLQVLRSGGALSIVTLFWEITSDPNNDLVNTYGNITFATGQTIGTVAIQIQSDDLPELDEMFLVHIISVSNGRLGFQRNAVLTILANDDPYGLFIFSQGSRPVRVAEGNASVTLTIQRLNGLMGAVGITYGTVNDNDRSSYLPSGVVRATNGSDYVILYGSATFAANESEANITLHVLDDMVPERAESVFVQLFSVVLVSGIQDRQIPDSPRLGSRSDTIAHVIIEANDDAFGVLQLSASAVRAAEDYNGPIISVTRTGGMFADVSVKFRTVPLTATVGEDYTVASSDVVLLDRETTKAVPILFINDNYPEEDETFLVELLNQTTGGAMLGSVIQALITIEASDDPYGSFVFQETTLLVEEPETGFALVILTVIRNAGTLGNVTLQWVATINGQLATSDLKHASGNITFTAGETKKMVMLEIMADDIPENHEIISVELSHASNGGSIGRERVVNITVPANDNPYGTVFFRQSVYRVLEPLEQNSVANITVRRSGGKFGRLQIFYSTAEIDVVELAIQEGQDMISYYDPATKGINSSSSRTEVNVTASNQPLLTCATVCLKERTCTAFSFANVSGRATCYWMITSSSSVTNTSVFLTFKKNLTSVSQLFSSQATSGIDFQPAIGHWTIMMEGEEFANVTVTLLTDNLPERDESFTVLLQRVELVNITASLKNQPSIGQPNITAVVIAMNGDAFGVFLIYSLSPNATEKGLYLEVTEQPQNTVPLVIERRGGSLGQVTVEWSVIGGTATRNIDFLGDGGKLTFEEGDVKKTITITILDDKEPEDNESIVISLTNTEGGSRILPSSDRVTLVILANDNVAGVISFQMASQSVTGREGETVTLNVVRTAPGRGNVTVNWRIYGKLVEQNFMNSTGIIFFPEFSLNAAISLTLLDDNIPEEKENYRVTLSDIKTQGVSPSGLAVLDSQGFEAVLTVEASDEPYGVLRFAPTSQMVTTQEANQTIQLFITREFGSLGAVNLTYETVKGSVRPLNLSDGALAEPGLDFISVSGSLMLQAGQTSAVISVTILEDDVPELQEFFLVNLTSVELITHILTASPPRLDAVGLVAQVTIDANDGARGVIQWQLTNFQVNETAQNLTLVIYRSKGTFGNVSVFFYPQNLEAHLGQDYNATPRVLTFTEGERYRFVDVHVLDDDIPEGDEKFQLILANPSNGLELGQNSTVTVTILANDDGHGILSFNNSQHFFLKEPTAQYLSESVATLYIIREPPRGIFGTVSVQYVITNINGSDPSFDLTSSHGYVILEEGVSFKILEISAILDEEPEMDELFTVTLLNPTGGARLGTHIETNITILKNQAPLGLFSLFPVGNRTNTITVEEGNRTLYLQVSRSNGLNTSVSVEWETQSDTAFGIKGDNSILSVFQTFQGQAASAWCFFTFNQTLYGIHLLIYPAEGPSIVYQWKGSFVPLQVLNILNPRSCTSFSVNDTSYATVTYGGINGRLPSNTSIYLFIPKTGLILIHTLTIPETADVRHFSLNNTIYLIFASPEVSPAATQVFRWNGKTFDFHHSLLTVGARGLALFTRGSILYLVVSQSGTNQSSVVYQWNSGQFRNPQGLPVTKATHAVSFTSGLDIYLLFASADEEGSSGNGRLFVWESGQSFFRLLQSIQFGAVNQLHSFIPSSGFTHILVAGKNKSALYLWNAGVNQLSFVLEASAANQLVPVNAPFVNGTKPLIAMAGNSSSQIYELTTISNQSDFIPSSGEFIFDPEDRELIAAVTIVDDNIPEDQESFRIRLKNPRGGAEIGANGLVTVIIPSNDDAHGIVAFSQNSLFRQVEELEQDNLVTLSVERLRGNYGRLTVQWVANGSITDISPTAGEVTFSDGQALSTISLTVLDDKIPEMAETVSITLISIATLGIRDPSRGAVIDTKRNTAVLTILPNDSPYGVIGWHTDSLFVRVKEPDGITALNVSLRIVREQGFVGDVAVYFTVKPNLTMQSSSQAMENMDYMTRTDAVIIKENTAGTNVTVAILPDDIPELQEVFLVNITTVKLVNVSLSGGYPSIKRPGMEISEIIIDENDDPRGIIQFSVTKDTTGAVFGYEVPPPWNILILPVIRKAGTFGRVYAYWEAQPLSASLDDFIPSSGNLTFMEGQVSASIEIIIVDDTAVEFQESFSITLTRVTGGASLGNETQVTVTIPPNDSPVGSFGFEQKIVQVSEPKSPGDPASMAYLTVVRSQGGRGAILITWVAEDGAKDDLSPLNGTLLFNETDTRRTFVVRAVPDAVLEGDERYTIQLISATNNAEISPLDGKAIITILGDQGASGSVGITPSSQNILIGEPMAAYNGTALVRIERGPGIFGEITVYWNITPPLQNEFVEISGRVLMKDRQSAATILLQVLDDDIPEERRPYQLQLTGVSNGAALNESHRIANITVVASDLPYGEFTFTQELLLTSEEARQVNISVTRSSGRFGQVQVWYQTSNSTAFGGSDFISTVGRIVFEPNVTTKWFTIDILDDSDPEGPEQFFVNLTRLELIGSWYDFTIRENRLQLDQPPRFGNLSSIRIVIQKNDNAEGVIEFDPRFVVLRVEEDVGTLMIPVVRRKGTYGFVTADFTTRSISAYPGGVDYSVPNNSVIFYSGQNQTFINITIIDDTEREFDEQFEIHLIAATGGAVLGAEVVTKVTIAKSDSPNGVIRFVNQSRITIPNPNTTQLLTLALERTGGLVGNAEISWHILGPNSREVLSYSNPDIGDPVNGSFKFQDGEGGFRTIDLNIYPHDEVEVQETFIITLDILSGESEVDPKAKNISLTILKFGHPNGIVQFSPESVFPKSYQEPSRFEGPLSISFLIVRHQGTTGNITVHWELSSDSDITGDFHLTSGFVIIPDAHTVSQIVIELLPDDIPELDENYALKLTSVEGGAELEEGKDTSRFTVAANDDPHGVLAISAHLQSVIVQPDLSRHLQINITRNAGTFGTLSVTYLITSFDEKKQVSFSGGHVRSITVEEGKSFAVTLVPINSQEFLPTGYNFTAELLNVSLISGNSSNLPRIQRNAESAIVPLPEEAANSEVGFKSGLIRLTNITAGTCQAAISRRGLYGSVTAVWKSGYLPKTDAETVPYGNITPAFGSIEFAHGEGTVYVPLHVSALVGKLEVFALQLTAVHSNVPGGAVLRSGFTEAEIEPMGVFQFAPNSTHVIVEENVQKVFLHVQKYFGFHGNKTKVGYEMIAGSAKSGEDYKPVQNGQLIFEAKQTDAIIIAIVIDDKIFESDEEFYVVLTSAETLDEKLKDSLPRINQDFNNATITILANDIVNGYLSLGPPVTYINEDINSTSTHFIYVKRSLGFSGVVQVTLKTFGRIGKENGLAGTLTEIGNSQSNLTWATEGLDFEEQITLVTLQDGEKEVKVPVRITDDSEPEGQEIFYVYLSDPEGGALIVEGVDQQGFAAFAAIIILGSDLQNGIMGFTAESQTGLVLDEDSDQRKLQLTVQRQQNRSFEDVLIHWRATFNQTFVVLQWNGTDLTNELVNVTGTAICNAKQTTCTITLEVRDDKVPEFEIWFFLEIYEVGEGAAIDNETRFARIRLLESDDPRGLIYFAVGSRLPVAHQKTKSVSLVVSRESSLTSSISVRYSMQELQNAEMVGRTLISPAIPGKDFVKSEGTLTFEPGHSSYLLDVTLTPDQASSSAYPKRFQVMLSNPTGGARIHPEYRIANVTIVSSVESQSVWGLVGQLYQPLDDNIVKRVLQNLSNKVVTEINGEQLGAVITVLEKVSADGKTRTLDELSRAAFYDILCMLVNPSRTDTKGYSYLSDVAENFAFSLLTSTECGSLGISGKTVLESCQYMSIKSYHWYPQQINGHKFDGKTGDYFQIPQRLLDASSISSNSSMLGPCEFLQFTEYSSQQWFANNDKRKALNDRIFSVSLKQSNSRPLNNSEVTFRILAGDKRIIPGKSLCLLWDQGAGRWITNNQYCRLLEDTANYVECACSHMSVYAVYAETDNLSTYNEAFFSAGFICISGFVLAILSHALCSRFSMFAAKLLTQMMVACLGAQISFVVSAYTSRQLPEVNCFALGLMAHYFYLCQFSWMLIQAVNFWHILVMNDEHTDRRYLLLFTLSWGLPAILIALLVIVLKGAYKWHISEIYGTIYGDLCFIPNVYAALFTAALVPMMCLVGVFVVFVHAYQVTQQWKAYDDIFKGRTNGAEVPLVLYLFALISVSWLWAGLHMAYRHLWMLVLFVIFNSLQGLYVCVVYFILHNQLCWPAKASYTVDTNVHSGSGSAFFTHGSGMPVLGGDINKSTQNLIAAMEEVTADWERASLQPGSQTSSLYKPSPQNGRAFTTTGGFMNGSLMADEESQEFDDLIFALKTGLGLNIGDNESIHGSQDGGSTANSQIVELRRIPIADTHL